MTNNNPKMDLFRLKKRGAVEEKIADSFHIFTELYDQQIVAEEKLKEIENNFTNISAKSYMLLKNFEELGFRSKDISNNEMTRAGDVPTLKGERIWTVDLDMMEMRGHTPFLLEEEKDIRWDNTPILQEEEKEIWGSYTNSSSSRFALQPHPSTSPRNFRSFRAFTLQTNIRTDHPPPSLSSSSSSYTHSKTRRALPTPQTTHHHLSSYGLSSKIASSHAQQKQSSTSCSQPSTTQIRPKQGINPRSDDALDLFIPAKLKIQVAGDQKEVSAVRRQYRSRIQEKEQTFRVVGKNWGRYRSCKEAEALEVTNLYHADTTIQRWRKEDYEGTKKENEEDEQSQESRSRYLEKSLQDNTAYYNFHSSLKLFPRNEKMSAHGTQKKIMNFDGKIKLTEVRWIKHYSSEHKILLVGEGDFSFSAALAVAFVSATNITATSLDSIEFVSKNYSRASSNIDKLQSLGAEVMHNVDATNMADSSLFQVMLFDRLVFNFPLAGFFPDEKREYQICQNQKLVLLFLANAKKMIHIDGEIHITHKSNAGFFKDWDLEFIASRVGLQLIEEVPFNFRDYPDYGTKYGFGGDKNFDCDPSKTYKFGHQKQFSESWI